MADTAPATPTPAPTPPPVKITVGQSLSAGARTVLIIIGLAVAVLAALEVYRHVHRAPEPTPIPAPPAPAPTPTPAPPVPAKLGIEVPADIRPDSLIRLQAVGPKLDDAEWQVLYAPDITRPIDVAELDPSGSSAVYAGPPGAYRITLMGTVAGKAAVASKPVTIPGVAPTPPKPPGPGPLPPGPPPDPGKPDPIASGFYAIGVFSGGQPAVLNDAATLAADIRELGGNFLKADVASTDPRIAGSGWMAAAKKAGGNSLVFVNPDGSLYSSAGFANPRALPADRAGILDAAKGALGKH